MHTNRVLFQIVIAAATLVGATSCDIDIAESTENHNQPKNVSGNYSFSISGGSEGSDTRAILNGGVYYWQPGDQVGLSIVETGETSPIIANNITLTSDLEEGKSTHTTFSGDLTSDQINNLTSDKTYDYYSYFPKGGGSIDNLLKYSFSIPSSITLTPDVFNPNYAPMAAVKTDQRPIVYLDGEDLVCPTDLVHFDYQHILSYAAIEMDVRLIAGTVNSITLKNTDRYICGSYTYNMSTGVGSITSGENSITITIEGGLTAGDGKVLYVPMPPVDMSGDKFTLTFNSSTTNKYESVVNVAGVKFERGKIHHLKVAPVVKYTASETFTITKTGYYFIEAWGGDGGKGGAGSSNRDGNVPGGNPGKATLQNGLYYFEAGKTLNVQVGTAGSNGTDNGYTLGTSHTAGGTGGNGGIGTWFGNGYRGGNGGNGHKGATDAGTYTGGGAGGGAGAASGVLYGGTAVSNIVIASGGGGGGGGGSVAENGANGGNSNTRGANTSSGTSYGPGGNAWSSSYTIGYAYGGSFKHDGNHGRTWARGRGGAGGGGGGWDGSSGGGGQSGGSPNNDSGGNAAGGGGAGGKSSSGITVANPGFTLPINARPTDRLDGYVVITYIR